MASRHHAVIVAAGIVDEAALAWLSVAPCDGPRPRLIAADGGAARCLAAGLRPDVVVGDLDSLAEEAQAQLRAQGVEVRRASRDKDESDLELCLLLARELGVTQVTVLGAMGLVRPEHTLANLLLLADPRFSHLGLVLVGHGSRTWRIGEADAPGEAHIEGRAGDHVSLLPLDPRVEGVRTAGLRFPLLDEDLALGPARGLSNELLAERGRVTTRRGRLVVVHTDRDAERAAPDLPEED
jgi:thiamine pyrophosphokinase